MTLVRDECVNVPDAPMAATVALRLRREFLRAARSRRCAAEGFLLQARRRDPDEPGGCLIRFGLTCSRKLGNAVVRNRARRRLRALARALLPRHGRPGWDYVLVGRPGVTVDRPMARLEDDLHRALDRVHGQQASRR